ncbi:MAG: hypothetical protein ABSE98_14160, partial [Acidimicrobiales bacterium]
GGSEGGAPLTDGSERHLQGPGHGDVIDRATLYLCRQGEKWVVVIESARISGALRLRDAGRDAYDARFELLSRARRACPGAAIFSTDGALESADFEWRVGVRSVEAKAGDIGIALHRDLSAEPETHLRRRSQRQIIRKCHWGRCPEVSGRPRSF